MRADGPSVAQRALRRERALTTGALVLVVLVCWGWLLAGAGMDMHRMDGMLMPMSPAEWTPGHFGLMLAMWATMMAAMMLPSAAPMLLFYGVIARRRAESGGRIGSTASFGLGYLAVWSAFSLAAVVLQYGLEQAALLSPMMETTSVALGGAILIAAGIHQWTPLKQACLRHCRSPLEFVTGYWRSGERGASAMGLRHGAYCLGCCWAVMLVLFVVGVMNLVWIAGLAGLVLLEKLAPRGEWIARASGLALIGWGAAMLATLA